MEFTTLILLLITGLIAGLAGGIMGVGGGIIIVPVLIYIFGFGQHLAQGTSLAFLLLPIGFLGVINYHKAGLIDWKFAIILGLAFTIGSYYGSKWAINLPADILRKVFAVFIVLVGLKMFFGK
ncbi:MAG: sulfite exporter TauE/SafE family protein [Bacteroidales bacterium]|nr:sulfite exporter TauE/SafE family protein [Bacteroidales bacterium]